MSPWSYTIMGSTEASLIDYRLFNFIYSHLSEEDRGFHRISTERVNSLFKDLIEKHYDELTDLVVAQKSRLAYQVFGVYLMRRGAKMTDKVKELIFEHSRWEDEEFQLLDPKDKSERFFYLSDFREKIKNYEEGINTHVPYESPDDIVQKLRKQGIIKTDYPFITPPEKTPIDHLIKG